MRIHIAACGYVVFFALKIGVSRGELACLFLAMGAVTCAEALNTSVEKLCDYVENRHNRQIGLVKDLAAGGVVLSAFFAALVGAAVLLRPELWAVVCHMAGTPWKLLVFLGTVLASLGAIFVVPLKK